MVKVLQVLVAVLLAATLAGPAAAEDPVLVNWPDLAPGVTPGLDPSDANECNRGDLRCVESVIRRMRREFARQARTCTHHAVFWLGYLRTTEEYHRAVQEPGFFTDPAWLNHYDAVFAQYYFDPWRDWRRGHRDAVPPAWRIAFQAAEDRAVSATGNFLQGMNAHINRDLPFVLDAIGLTDADGNSRHPDHTKVNEFLNRVGDDLRPEVAWRLDPTFDDGDVPGTADDLAVMQVIVEWRERAWRNAELMTNLPLLAPAIAQGIEAGAAVLAEQIREATAYPPGSDASTRDAWCADHWDDWPASHAGEDDPQDVAGADLSDPEPEALLSSLALLGVHVDVSIRHGVVVTVG